MSVKENFKGLPMEDLIGAPLIAAANAQGKLSTITHDFIKSVGLTQSDDPKNKGKKITTLNTIKMSYTETKDEKKNQNNNNNNNNNNSQVVKKTIEVPLLTVVNIPNLKVKKVDINFEMEVKEQTASKTNIDTNTEFDIKTKSWWSPVTAKVSGSVSTKHEHTRNTDSSAKYSIKVQAEDDGPPEGLSRLLTMLSNIITEKEEK